MMYDRCWPPLVMVFLPLVTVVALPQPALGTGGFLRGMGSPEPVLPPGDPVAPPDAVPVLPPRPPEAGPPVPEPAVPVLPPVVAAPPLPVVEPPVPFVAPPDPVVVEPPEPIWPPEPTCPPLLDVPPPVPVDPDAPPLPRLPPVPLLPPDPPGGGSASWPAQAPRTRPSTPTIDRKRADVIGSPSYAVKTTGKTKPIASASEVQPGLARRQRLRRSNALCGTQTRTTHTLTVAAGEV